MFLFSFGAQLALFLVLISHITYCGAQMSYISVLISHIANFGAQLSLFLVLISHVFTLVLNCLFSWCPKHTSFIAVLRYWSISGIKVENIQDETQRKESPMLHSYVSLPRLSPMSLVPLSLSSMPLPYVSFSYISLFHVSRLSRCVNSPLALFPISLL